ncbi:MAG: outer membrane protein transport protein, partial [Thalassospira sp.]|nr:outer membrane protein transport protein [Thalassospira sp.]
KTPAVATFGVQHDLTPEWTLGMEAQWTQWGSTEEFRARFTSGQADNVTDADWSDAWFYSLGGSYRPDQGRAIYRFGAGFDQSPVSNRTREVRVPDSNRYWLSAGAGYELTSNVRLDATYLAMQFDDGRISQNASGSNALRGTLNGEFNSFLNIISLQLSSKF